VICLLTQFVTQQRLKSKQLEIVMSGIVLLDVFYSIKKEALYCE
jgi:hypothetical protein